MSITSNVCIFEWADVHLVILSHHSRRCRCHQASENFHSALLERVLSRMRFIHTFQYHSRENIIHFTMMRWKFEEVECIYNKIHLWCHDAFHMPIKLYNGYFAFYRTIFIDFKLQFFFSLHRHLIQSINFVYCGHCCCRCCCCNSCLCLNIDEIALAAEFMLTINKLNIIESTE